MTKKLFLLFVLILQFTITAIGQRSFDPQTFKNRVLSADGYQLRNKDSRYEGIFKKDYGSERFRLVSVIRGELDYELASGELLKFSVSPVNDIKEIGVTGSSFGLDVNYRLDFVLPTNKTVTVPVKEVIKPQYIYSSNLGVYGYIGEASNPNLYVPVRVSSSSKTTDDKINVTLISNVPVAKIIWRFAKYANGVCAGYRNGEPIDGTFSAHQGINVPLVFPSDIKPGDQVCIEIQGVLRETNTPVIMSSFKMLITR